MVCVFGCGLFFFPSHSRCSSGLLFHTAIGRRVGFGPATALATSGGPRQTTVADVDGDGNLDVVLGKGNAGDVEVYFNTGGSGSDMSFSTALVVDNNMPSLFGVVAADFDGDGDVDLAGASFGSNAVYWYENGGGGTFPEARKLASGTMNEAHDLRAADFDGDGDVDLVVYRRYNPRISWLRNSDGNGTFTFMDTGSPTGYGKYLDVADIDGDGDVDVVSDDLSGNVWKWTNSGSGSFSRDLIQGGTGGVRLVFGDFDGDGDQDFALAVGGLPSLAWYRNNGGGGFFRKTVSSLVSTPGEGVTAMDVDDDGDLDLVATNSGSDRPSWFENVGGADVFDPTPHYISTGALGGTFLSNGDFNNDGVADVVLSSLSPSRAEVIGVFPQYCPDFEAGALYAWTYTFEHPDWKAQAVCSPGYGLFGVGTRWCMFGTSTWDAGAPPTCVFNASSVNLVIPPETFPTTAGSSFPFLLQGSGSGLAGSSSVEYVISGGGPPVVSPSTYDPVEDSYSSTWTAPQVPGDYDVSFLIDGNVVATLTFNVVPSVFAGRVEGGSAATAIQGVQLNVRVLLEDEFGNAIVLPSEGFEGAPLGTLPFGVELSAFFRLDVASSTANVNLALTPRRDGSGFDAFASITTVVVGPHTLSVFQNGVDHVPGSPVAVSSVCPPGTALEVGSTTTCVAFPCGSLSIRVANENATQGSGSSFCVCVQGAYAVDYGENGVVVCAPCPQGARCALGLDPPSPLPGFYPSSNDTFVRCLRPSTCLGGTQVCARGSYGYMCNTCSSGFYTTSTKECEECPSNAVPIFSGLVVGLVMVGLSLALVVGVGMGRSGKDEPESSSSNVGERRSDRNNLRKRKMPASVSIVLVHMQVVGILAAAKFDWSDSAESAMAFFRVTNLEGNIAATECSISSFHVKYLVSVAAPLIVLATAMIAVVVAKALGLFGLGDVRVRTVVDGVIFSVVPLLYIPISKASFDVFDCVRLPNGDFVIDSDPGVACFDSDWWSIAWFGGLVVILFVLGAPAYFLGTILVRRHKLLDPRTFKQYGSLYKLFLTTYYWAGIADIGKRLLIVCVATFFSEHVLWQICLLYVLLSGSSYFVFAVQPYFFPLYNVLEFRLSIVTLGILSLGTASYAERNTNSSSTTVFVALIFLICAMIFISLIAIVQDARQVFQERGSDMVGSVSRARSTALVATLNLEAEELDLDPSVKQIMDSLCVALTRDAGGGLPRDRSLTYDEIELESQ